MKRYKAWIRGKHTKSQVFVYADSLHAAKNIMEAQYGSSLASTVSEDSDYSRQQDQQKRAEEERNRLKWFDDSKSNPPRSNSSRISSNSKDRDAALGEGLRDGILGIANKLEPNKKHSIFEFFLYGLAVYVACLPFIIVYQLIKRFLF
jgi:hypothetical protein